MERTFLMIKPDGVQRGVAFEIMCRFEKRGYKLCATKFITPSKELLEEHYAEHKGKPFLSGLVEYMSSGPVLATVWEGSNIIKNARAMMGATKPDAAEQGTIRATYAQDVGRNLIHGSDSIESAEREICLWFTPEEIHSWKFDASAWIHE